MSPGEGRPAAAAGGGEAHHWIESMIRGYFLLISGRYRVITKGFEDFFFGGGGRRVMGSWWMARRKRDNWRYGRDMRAAWSSELFVKKILKY